MKKKTLFITSALAFASFALSSCDTPTGQGAGWGAVTGAVLGAAATGDARGAAVGALIGAHTGALIGATVELDERGYYDGHPRDYYPYARPTFYYTDGEPTGTVKDFVDFTLSEAGQKIVEQVGFVPIR